MSDYKRLISYVYMYRQNEKGKNTGFLKLESRNGQCKIGISLKGLPAGTADLEVLLFSKTDEVSLGKIYIRNGQGELRIITDQESLVGTGIPLNLVGGLKIRNSQTPDVYYATIWDDGIADVSAIPENANILRASEETQALSQEDCEEKFSENDDESEHMRKKLLKKTFNEDGDFGGEVETADSKEMQEDSLKEKNVESQDSPCGEESSSGEDSVEEIEGQQGITDMNRSGVGQREANIRRPMFGYHREQGFYERTRMNRSGRRLQVPDMSAQRPHTVNKQNIKEETALGEIKEIRKDTYIEGEREYIEINSEGQGASDEAEMEEAITSQNEAALAIPEEETIQPETDCPPPERLEDYRSEKMESFQPERLERFRPEKTAHLHPERMERREPPSASLWDGMVKRFPKSPQFDIDLEHEVLAIQPQDIGLLPRETWMFGNNSFLLHGYYQHRYLVLVRIVDDKERYFLGVPGFYHNNERFMANMFGFTNFYLAGRRPDNIERFGFWCTEIKL